MATVIDPSLLSLALRGLPFVAVDLLRTLPSNLDISTWDKAIYLGYSQQQVQLKLMSESPPDAWLYQCRCAFDVPTEQATLPYYGVSLGGQGVAIGQLQGSDNMPLLNFSGPLHIVIAILYQSYIPQV